MDEILDYHPEDFDVCVRPGVTRESLNHHIKDDGMHIWLIGQGPEFKPTIIYSFN